MPEQFMNPDPRARWLEQARQQKEKYRREVGPTLFQTMLGENVPPSKQVLDPYSEHMKTEYIYPSGQPDPETQALRAENDARIAGLEVPQAGPPMADFPQPGAPSFMGPVPPDQRPGDLGFMGPQEPDLGRVAPLGDMPGPQEEMPRDQFDILGEAALEKEGGDTKRKWQRIAAALARGGATASSGRTVMDFLQGTAPRAPDMSTYDMLNQMADKGEAKAEAKFADATNPLRTAYNKEFGTNLETMDQVREDRKARAAETDILSTEEGIEASKAKRAAVVDEQQTATDRAKRFMEGDMSAAPEKIKTKVLSEANTWTKNNEHIASALSEADKIETFLEAENSVGARIAITQMVLLGGETGRLTEGDIKRSAERMGFKGVQDFLKNFVISDLNQEQRQEILDIVVRAREHARRGLRKSAKTHVNRLVKLYPSFKSKDMMEMFLGEELASGKEKEKEIWMVDPTGEYPPEKIVESKRQIYIDAEWVDG